MGTNRQKPPPGRLEGRIAVVVGVGSAIGASSALAFAEQGAHVLAVDPNEDVAARLCKDAGGLAGTCTAQVGDLAGDRAAEVADRCSSLWDRVDVLFVCSAAIDWWPLESESMALWDDVVRVNLLGPVAYTQALLPLLERSSAGSIIYLGSIDGIRGNANVPAYSTSKGGLLPLTHLMADRCGPRGIRVNCIATGTISQTPTSAPDVQRTISDPYLLMRMTPLRRRVQPAEVASVALFFASSDSTYVSGVVLPVDGGRLAATPGTNLVDLE